LSTPLEFTGERFTPECVREIWYEHFHRYALAARWCRNMHTLDAACGEGYGSALLASDAARVAGVDIDSKAIEHARARYGSHAGLSFHEADCTKLPFDDDEFDRVVSFETLEHLEAHDELLAEFRRVLKPDGLLILSSPDKAVYTDELKTENEFHVRELYRDELETLLGRYFPAYRLLGQKLMFHSVIWSLDHIDRLQLDHVSGSGLESPASVPSAPVYFIAVCAADEASLPDVSGQAWLFDDAGESVYQHYNAEVRFHMSSGKTMMELNERIEALTKQLEEARTARVSWWRRLFRLR
jgi:SAM-dependent methyltransferase